MADIQLTLGGTGEDNPYLRLGRAIAGQCPTGFEEARLEATLREGGPAELRLACTPEGGGETRPDLDAEAREGIEALLEAVRERDGGGWRECTVTLRKGGHFAMDVRG